MESNLFALVHLYHNYRHVRTHGKYRVWAFTEIQQPNGDWVPGVIYSPVGQTKNYTRPIESFIEKFEIEQ